jgi:autoinducer 2-degrading protein
MQEVLFVEFRIHVEHVASFAQAIKANAKASLELEPGCLRFDVCRDTQDPALFYLYEIYIDDAAVKAHLAAPHFLSMDRETAEWVESKVVLRLQLEPQS